MNIGIDTLWVVPGEVGGAEYYLTNLLRGLCRVDLRNRYVLFVTPANEGLYDLPADRFRKVVLPFSNEHRGLRILCEQVALPLLARREGLDVLHCPDNATAPFLKTCGLVLTIQSLHCFLFREELPRLKMGYIRSHLRLAARRADHVITPSESTRRDAIRLLPLAPGRVSSVLDYVSVAALFPDGIRVDPAVPARHGVTGPYLFSPSSLYAYKNVEGMLHTLRRLRERHGHPHVLVVAGRDDVGHYRSTRRLADAIGVGAAYRYLGPVAHDEVPSWYAGADVTFFPSLCETFGIPVLESMAVGTPVVCSDRTSLPEVAGDGAVLVDPEDVGAMTRAVHELISEPGRREGLRRRGLARAGTFSCEAAARRTMEIYERVAAFRGGSG